MRKRRALSVCLSNAWIQGHATWTLGNVTKTSIVVKSIQVSYRAGDTRDRSETYAINTGGPADCCGQSAFAYKPQPVS
ncbi:hypothetical protein HEP81_01927 [Streptomyces griseofuscus]|uniref:Uncharacterized protein n=1 Tax=Streptomyces griseofuscus TaxID=146922 RepID=A0A7H1PW24_9ACTN|nr:hypothetical protein [Streptomyces griseofuscus]QNT92254.1 hypothetical protein HEP81_01927 [Streptomyces griseofuscus]